MERISNYSDAMRLAKYHGDVESSAINMVFAVFTREESGGMDTVYYCRRNSSANYPQDGVVAVMWSLAEIRNHAAPGNLHANTLDLLGITETPATDINEVF